MILLRSMFLLAIISIPGTIANAAQYSVTALNYAGYDVHPSAINSSGQITGYLRNQSTPQTAFLYDGSYHLLGTLGGTTSQGVDINSSGTIAGTSKAHIPLYGYDNAEYNKPFYNDGTMHNIDPVAGTGFVASGSSASAINDQGQVVGTYLSYTFFAFLYHNNTWTDIGGYSLSFDFGYVEESHGSDINNLGQVVGYVGGSTNNNGYFIRAFFYDGTIHDVGSLGGINSGATALNDNGQIVGSSETSAGLNHAFLYENGSMFDLGTLGGNTSSAVGINSLGQIIGTAKNAGSADRPFIYDSVNGMIDLNTLIDPLLGWDLRSVAGINDVGQIVGYGRLNGVEGGFLLTPVPEASTLLLAGSGMITLVGFAYFRRRAVNASIA